MMNLAFGWLWITLGFADGLAMGLLFQREDWLGGYSALRRRMVRLAHVAFFGLGLLNVLFALSVPALPLAPVWLAAASWALVVGGVTMPLCCFLMAWRPVFTAAFAVPICSLLFGGLVISLGVLCP
jgi:hypothetical protein